MTKDGISEGGIKDRLSQITMCIKQRNSVFLDIITIELVEGAVKYCDHTVPLTK